MRIDKFLWNVRLFKTRSLATEACRSGRVFMDEQAVKSAKEIKPGDNFMVRQQGEKRFYKIVDLPSSRVGAPLVATYLTDLTPDKATDAFVSTDRGSGRPTKRDRRSIEIFKQDLDNDF